MDASTELMKMRRCIKMIDRNGFIELFNQEIKVANQGRRDICLRDIFEGLNEEYRSFTGKYRFSDYDSFRHFSNKQNK